MTLKASGISKRFNNHWALRDVSFEVSAGRVLGVFGPAGCGKSTLLRIISGIEKPNGGRVELDSQDLTKSARDRNIYLLEPPRQKGLARVLGSAPVLAEQRSAAILGALESDAQILLIDNAFTDLDREEKSSRFSEFRAMAANKGICVLYATANFDDVLEFCDEAAIILKGELQQVGTPEHLYSEPINTAVACLTGRNNIFEARRLTSSKAEVPEFQTIVGSHRISVRKFEKARLGPLNQNVKLAIRPEHISISFGASFPEDNLVKASVKKTRFLGASTLVELNADGLHVEALVTRLVGLEIGDECMLGMPPDRIVVLAD